MKKYIFVLGFLFCQTAYAADAASSVQIEDTGVSKVAVSGTAITKSIDMEGSAIVTNQLSLTLMITAGTTTTVQVKCYESANNSTWGQVSLCDWAMPISLCKPDTREFTLSDYTLLADGRRGISTRWSAKKRYIKCSVYGTGSGTVTITGSRSWQ